MRISDWSSDVCSSDLMPLFGICLGHQILGLALNGKTLKMKRAHHGANHPVQDLGSALVMITSQKHGFAIAESNLHANMAATQRSLFACSTTGRPATDEPAFSFQGHPDANHGPAM